MGMSKAIIESSSQKLSMFIEEGKVAIAAWFYTETLYFKQAWVEPHWFWKGNRKPKVKK